MSRSDYPPGYDDSHGPLYAPQGGGYPPPPAYGFPSYGGPPPGGHPGAPYPTGPNAALFPGQPGGYPPGPYPGQPQPAGPPGSGYHNPPPMPPVMPPIMPSNVLSSDDEEFAARGSDWDDLSIRHAFIRKVYMILAAQLLVTTAIVAVFTFVHPVRTFVQRNPAVYWASYAVYFITHLVLVCCKGPRRKFPWNVILLLIFTLALSYMTGSISSHYATKAVFLALGITAVVCVAVTVFCFQTKVRRLHQVPGPLLRAGDRDVRYRHHHSHRAVLQIYAVASHALRRHGSHRLHFVPGVSHPADHRQQEALHQPGGVRVRRALHLRGHRPDLHLPAANHRLFHEVADGSL